MVQTQNGSEGIGSACAFTSFTFFYQPFCSNALRRDNKRFQNTIQELTSTLKSREIDIKMMKVNASPKQRTTPAASPSAFSGDHGEGRGNDSVTPSMGEILDIRSSGGGLPQVSPAHSPAKLGGIYNHIPS